MELENPMDGHPVVIEAQVAWGKMDAFQHVRNIVYSPVFRKRQD